jgi:hypothetical protein
VVAFILASPSKSFMHSCSIPYVLHVFSPINLHGVVLNWLSTGRTLPLMPYSLRHIPEDSTILSPPQFIGPNFSSVFFLYLPFLVCLSNILFYIILHYVLLLSRDFFIYLFTSYTQSVFHLSNYLDLSLLYLFSHFTHVDTSFILSTAVTLVTKAWNWIPRTFIERLHPLNGIVRNVTVH